MLCAFLALLDAALRGEMLRFLAGHLVNVERDHMHVREARRHLLGQHLLLVDAGIVTRTEHHRRLHLLACVGDQADTPESDHAAEVRRVSGPVDFVGIDDRKRRLAAARDGIDLVLL